MKWWIGFGSWWRLGVPVASSSQNPLLYSLVRNSCALGFSLFIRLRVTGRERIPLSDPVLVASNHLSHFDPPLIGSVFPRPLHYLAKAELFEKPLLGPLIRGLGACPVSREDSQKAGTVLKLMLRFLEEGKSLLLFPEGTRSLDGTLQPLEGGIAFLSLKARVPVVPAWISGTYEAFPRGASFPRFVPLRVSFGDPLDPSAFLGPQVPEREARASLLRALESSLRSLAASSRP